MIYLKAEKSFTTNIVYSNLLDRFVSNIIPPFPWSWLLVFTNDFTKEKFKCLQILEVTAQQDKVSNMVLLPFNVKIGGTANGLNQQLAIDNLGYYSYDIYYQTSLTNLDPDNSVVNQKKVQTGKALIYSEKEYLEEYIQQKDGNPNNFIYVS